MVRDQWLLTLTERQAELEALLALLRELAQSAAEAQRTQLHQLHSHLLNRLPQLLTFVELLDQMQHDLGAVLPREHQALLGWIWLRRQRVSRTSAEIVLTVPAEWRAATRAACGVGRRRARVERGEALSLAPATASVGASDVEPWNGGLDCGLA